MVKLSKLFLVALLVMASGTSLFAAKKASGGGQKEGWWELSSKQKQGGFIGGEFGVGGAYVCVLGASCGDGFSPNLNVMGGYQWYFMDEPFFHLGLRLKGHLGYSYYGADLGYYGRYAASTHSLQIGVEPSFIWDVLQYKKHTLGAYISPLGFEVGTYFGSASGNYVAEKTSYPLTTYTKFIYLFGAGVHYYYDAKHMVFAGYRYRKVFGGYSSTTQNTAGFIVYPWHSFVVGYAYKF